MKKFSLIPLLFFALCCLSAPPDPIVRNPIDTAAPAPMTNIVKAIAAEMAATNATLNLPDFSIVQMGDLQNCVATATGRQYVTNSISYLIAMKSALNIKAVVLPGDLTDDGTDETQWLFITNQLARLYAAGIPFYAAAGNHDKYGGNHDAWNNHMGAFMAAQPGYESRLSATDYYGTSWFQTNSGLKLNFIALGYATNATDFANIAAFGVNASSNNADHISIFLTHGYLSTDSIPLFTPDTGYDSGINGIDWWSNCFKLIPSAAQVLCGHDHPGAFARLTQFNDWGTRVDSVLFNEQDAANGGGNFIRFYRWMPNHNWVLAYTVNTIATNVLTTAGSYFLLPITGVYPGGDFATTNTLNIVSNVLQAQIDGLVLGGTTSNAVYTLGFTPTNMWFNGSNDLRTAMYSDLRFELYGVPKTFNVQRHQNLWKRIYDKQPIRAGFVGDVQWGEVAMAAVERSLTNWITHYGWAMNYSGRWYMGEGAGTTVITSDTDCWGQHYHMPNNGTVTNNVAHSATRIELFWVKMPTFGTLLVETNRGGAWGTLETLAGSAAATVGAATNWTVPAGDYNLRVTSSGTNILVGASTWDNTAPSYRGTAWALGGLDVLATMAAVSTNVMGPILQGLDLDVLIIGSKDPTNSVTTNIPILEQMFTNWMPNMDVIYYSESPSTDLTGYEGMVQMRWEWMAQAAAYNRMFYDGWMWLTPTNYNYITNFWVDVAHPQPFVNDFMVFDMVRLLNLDGESLYRLGYTGPAMTTRSNNFTTNQRIAGDLEVTGVVIADALWSDILYNPNPASPLRFGQYDGGAIIYPMSFTALGDAHVWNTMVASNGYYFPTNAGPAAAAPSPGWAYIWVSNSVPYMLSSGPTTAWRSTNALDGSSVTGTGIQTNAGTGINNTLSNLTAVGFTANTMTNTGLTGQGVIGTDANGKLIAGSATGSGIITNGGTGIGNTLTNLTVYNGTNHGTRYYDGTDNFEGATRFWTGSFVGTNGLFYPDPGDTNALRLSGGLQATFFETPTNVPVDAYVLTAAGTGGKTAWKVATGTGQTNKTEFTADSNFTVTTNTASGVSLYSLALGGTGSGLSVSNTMAAGGDHVDLGTNGTAYGTSTASFNGITNRALLSKPVIGTDANGNFIESTGQTNKAEVAAGSGITVATNTTSGVTLYTITGSGAQTNKSEVAAGSGATITTNTTDGVTLYTVSATGSQTNKTEVAAGTGTTVTTNTTSGVTLYTITSTATGGSTNMWDDGTNVIVRAGLILTNGAGGSIILSNAAGTLEQVTMTNGTIVAQTNLITKNWKSPTNAPTDGNALLATGTGGDTKWGAAPDSVTSTYVTGNNAVLTNQVYGSNIVQIVTNNFEGIPTPGLAVPMVQGATTRTPGYTNLGTAAFSAVADFDTPTQRETATNTSNFITANGNPTIAGHTASTNSGNYITANGNPTIAAHTASTNTGNYITANGNPTLAAHTASTNTANYITANGNDPLGTASAATNGAASWASTTASVNATNGAASWPSSTASLNATNGAASWPSTTASVNATNSIVRSATGAIFSTNAPTGYGVADTNWVLGQIAQLGSTHYFTAVTNTTSFTNSTESVARTNNFVTWLTVPSTVTTQSFGALEANAYIRHNVTTNTYAVISAGPANVSSYCYRTGSGTVSGHYELYAYDTVSNLLYELASSAPVIITTGATPIRYEWQLSIANDFVATNATKVVVAFKLDQIGTSTPVLSFINGGQYDAHFSFVRPLSTATIMGSQISGPVASATSATGATYATNLTSVTSLIPDSLPVPMTAWWTNWLDGAFGYSTPALCMMVSNIGSGFRFTPDATNAIRCTFSLPDSWDGGVVRLGLRTVCTNAQENTGNNTNAVFAVRATALGDGDDVGEILANHAGTAIWLTNGVNATAYGTRQSVSRDVTVGNTGTRAKTIVWDIEMLGAGTGDTFTNVGGLMIINARIYYNHVLTNSIPDATTF